MPRKRAGEKALNTWLSPAFAGTVERIANARGLSKSGLVRDALVAAVLPEPTDD